MLPYSTSRKAKKIYRRLLEAFDRHYWEIHDEVEEALMRAASTDRKEEFEKTEFHDEHGDYLDAIMMFEAWLLDMRRHSDEDSEDEPKEVSESQDTEERVDGHALATYALLLGLSMGREDRLNDLLGGPPEPPALMKGLEDSDEEEENGEAEKETAGG